MFDQFRTEPHPPRRDLNDLRRYSEKRGHELRQRARWIRAGLITAGMCAGVAGVVVPLTALSTGSSRSNVAVSTPATPMNTSKTTPIAGSCTAENIHSQRSPAMPSPERASEPIRLSPTHSPDLLPASENVVPVVSAESAWGTAHLPTSGGGHAVIVFGIYPTAASGSKEPSTRAWLVYASNVALTNGYPTGGPPLFSVRGPCQFGYVAVAVDATTGTILERSAGLY